MAHNTRGGGSPWRVRAGDAEWRGAARSMRRALVRGMICFMTAAVPARSDEPPATTKMASSALAFSESSSSAGPICRTISRPVVACPAITSWLSCGCISDTSSGDAAARRSASACDCASVVP
eukprot:2254517-Prymnesium_polylepis.1